MRPGKAVYVDPLLRPSIGSTLSATPSPQGLLLADPPPDPDLPPEQPPDDSKYELLRHEHFDQRYAPPEPTELATTFRHSFWATARERTRRAMVDAGFPAGRRLRFQSCGASPIVQVDALSGQVRVCSCNCHDTWCRACGRTRRQKLARAISGAIGRRRTVHIVLTLLSNDDPLGKVHHRLLDCFSRLRRRSWWKKRAAGGAWVFEATNNATTKLWHGHLHVIAHASWMQLQELSSLWKEITGDSHRVHISLVNNAPSVVRELTKYVGKITHRSWAHDHDLMVHAMQQLKGRRLCGAFGSWTSVQLQPHDDEVTPRQWIAWGTLDAMFRLAAQGDPDALELKAALAEGRRIRVPPADDPNTARTGDLAKAARPPPSCAPLSPSTV